MSIEPVGAVSAFSPMTAIGGLTNTDAAESTGGPDFGAMVAGGLEKLQSLQTTSDNLAIEAATGRLQDVHNYLIAANEAGLAVQLTVAVRNKAVEAFNEIMRLQA